MPTNTDSLFESLVQTYANTAEHNDALHRLCTEQALGSPLLAQHRRHIESNRLGFGDVAFHRMWELLLLHATRRFSTVRAVEIGVYKGQVISLWALLARHYGLDVRITAISPFSGQPKPRWRWTEWLRYRLDRGFRERIDNGDFYPDEDYGAIVRQLFQHFELDFGAVDIRRGLSTDPALLAGLGDAAFELIYVDGDHTYEGALHDFTTFGPKVVRGGWLIADDAGAALPGKTFWKGHRAVSRAADVLTSMGFRNVVNVGHNRVFERV